MNNKILIVEDDPKISRFVSLELMHEGYETEIKADGREALEAALANEYGLIILDVMLPSLNGIEVILTARDQVMDKVSGLDVGANDYMTKPFAIEELLARIRANLRKTTVAGEIMTLGRLVIDCGSVSVTYDSHPIELTKREFDLLVYLMRNKNIVVTREQALDAVWGFEFYGNTNVVDVYIRYLRSKIDDIYNIELIQTVRGAGYVIRDRD